MAERASLSWFRERLAASRAIEPRDPAPILAWRETHRSSIQFRSVLIGLDQVRDWSRDEHGNIRHKSGQFLNIEGARVEGGDVREVTSWDQPIMTRLDGGLLGMLARETPKKGVEFLLQAIAECGNIDVLQLGPSIQSTWPHIGRERPGKRPPMIEVFAAETGVRIVYRANHTEEGSRFWKRSNQNVVIFLDDERVIETDLKMFYWASLSQIKELALMDNVLNPFVKTILMPL
jgi:dTDP-4-dehydro-6-deoxy-alpha-D-glucopyranose 2,3-dehydratase